LSPNLTRRYNSEFLRFTRAFKTFLRLINRPLSLLEKRGNFIDNSIQSWGEELMQAKELDMLIIHMGMELNLDKTLCHFLVAQLQDLEPNVSRKH
jgi:hypothetical protein